MFQALSDRDSGYGEMGDPPPSLWRMVEDQVPPSERAEIRRILGEAAVDLSLDLHAEVEVLLELCREIRSCSPSSLQRPPSGCSILADPPAIKEMVTQEIRMLLLSVRSKARRQGLDEDQALSKYNPKVVIYVMGPGRPESRAQSRESRWGRPMSASRAGDGRPLSSLSSGSSIEDDLEEIKDKLKIADIDEVVQHLRSLLEEESQSLKREITNLQELLEEDYLYAEEIRTPEPSLTELKEERRIIERDLQSDRPPVTPVQSAKMASARITTPPARSLEAVKRDLLGDPGRRAPPQTPGSSELHRYKRAPCPPHPKLRTTQEALCSTPPPPSRRGPSAGQELGSHHPHKPANAPGSLERLSRVYAPGRSTGPSTMNCVPAESSQSTHGVKPPDALYVPAPPPAQRPPSGANSAPAFRRARAKAPTIPP
ncbi:coiled-coil domain-containing protein 24 [Rana temporaria]|uniref:coiled-coil domain-containing protein 24 n=1 Tax=Rana temporaria TaxID=8407 RepID=UPI001AADAA23|nr:coiled-coil domain-containing protein 24 [Rana temporaria]